MTAPSAIQTVEAVDDPRQLALLQAVGLDKLSPPQRELALNIAARYDLDLLLKHLVMIEGRPYITRDGLLHVAHKSGQFDGIETTEPTLVDGFWRSTCSVYRKDMSHPFTYTGRYPETGSNRKFAPEMAVKVGEVMSLRRAFDVAAPAFEERWDVETTVEPPPPPKSLADRVAEKAAEVAEPPPVAPGQESLPTEEIDYTEAVEQVMAHKEAKAATIAPDAEERPVTAAPPPAGLSVQELSDKAKAAGVGKLKFAVALDCVPADVGSKVEAMTDEQRFGLAQELGLVPK